MKVNVFITLLLSFQALIAELRLVEAQSHITPNHYLGEFIDPEIREDESDANLITLDSSFAGEPDNIEFYENKIGINQ